MSQEEHTRRYIFALAPSEAKLSAKRGFGQFWAFWPDLTSEVTGWPRTSSLYINRIVSWRTTRSFVPRSSSSLRGETARGVHTMNPHLCREKMRNGSSNSISRKYAQNLILLFESRCIRLRPQKKSEGYFGVYFLCVFIKLNMYVLQLVFSVQTMLLTTYRECISFSDFFSVTLSKSIWYLCTITQFPQISWN